MFYTFEFVFTHPATNKEDEIQFCAETLQEAVSLFETWCKADEKLDKTPSFTVRMIYNAEDAEEYGENYGVEFPD